MAERTAPINEEIENLSVSDEFQQLVHDLIDQYRPTLEALAAHDAGASEEEITDILHRGEARQLRDGWDRLCGPT